MTEQLKAEAWLRSQRPALLELSFGCAVTPINGKGSIAVVTKVYENDTFDAQIEVETGEAEGLVTLKAAKIKNCTIIGHPIQLNDWLAVLEGKVRLDYTIGDIITVYDGKDNVIDFDLMTGQPNSPEDYKNFNDITSV